MAEDPFLRLPELCIRKILDNLTISSVKPVMRTSKCLYKSVRAYQHRMPKRRRDLHIIQKGHLNGEFTLRVYHNWGYVGRTPLYEVTIPRMRVEEEEEVEEKREADEPVNDKSEEVPFALRTTIKALDALDEILCRIDINAFYIEGISDELMDGMNTQLRVCRTLARDIQICGDSTVHRTTLCTFFSNFRGLNKVSINIPSACINSDLLRLPEFRNITDTLSIVTSDFGEHTPSSQLIAPLTDVDYLQLKARKVEIQLPNRMTALGIRLILKMYLSNEKLLESLTFCYDHDREEFLAELEEVRITNRL